MTNVFFKPWIGNKYGKENSVFSNKILVLGDSHYIDEGDFENDIESNDFTTGVVNDYLDEGLSGRWKSTFTKFMNSFVQDSDHSDVSRADLWNSVAFYNYLQVPAGSESRQTQYFDYSGDKHRLAFFEVISQLNPDFIISWGNNVWDVIPDDFGFGKGLSSEKFNNCCFIYPYNDKDLKLIGITHPSTSFDSSYWGNVFSELGANQ